MSVFQGLNVIEISATGAAGWATAQLADWGARVIVLEPADGTPLRDEPPYYQHDGERRSAHWQWLARGKTAVRVGDGLPTSAADARALCERADVVIAESELSESVLGLAPAAIQSAFEGKTTFVLISPFGVDGPYADYQATDLGVHALSGWAGMLGDVDRGPLRPAGDLSYRTSGLTALVGALYGLRHHRQGAPPQFITVTGQAVSAGMLLAPWLSYGMTGETRTRSRGVPAQPVRCKDGWVIVSPLTPGQRAAQAKMFSAAGAGAAGGPGQGEQSDSLREWYESRTREEIYTEAQQWTIPAAPIHTVAERLEDAQLNARGFFRSVEVDGKQVKVPRVPYLLRDASPVERGPLQEAATVQIEAAAAPQPAPQPDGPPRLPLEGVRVVDMSWFWSGPHATMTLGALGADVIKVESVQRPDTYRFLGFAAAGSETDRPWERGAIWNDSNQNKRGITLDLTSEAGMRLFEQLLQQADVVISNFSNRVLPNLGLSVERFHEINPDLVVVTMPGYGADGPWGKFVGYGVTFEQLVIAEMNGYADGPPRGMGGSCDPIVGMYTVAAVEIALRLREQTGRGTAVEAPQCEILDSLLAPEHIAVQHGADPPSRDGNKHARMAPHDVYRVAGDDEWISIAVDSDEEFAALARVIGQPELARDARFATAVSRKDNEEALNQAVAAAVRECDLLTLERELQAAGVKGCRVSKAHLLTEDGGLRNFGFFQTMTRELTGTHPYKTVPLRFSGFELKNRRPAPLLGEHSREVLTGLLGLSDDEVSRLEAEHVTGTEPLFTG